MNVAFVYVLDPASSLPKTYVLPIESGSEFLPDFPIQSSSKDLICRAFQGLCVSGFSYDASNDVFMIFLDNLKKGNKKLMVVKGWMTLYEYRKYISSN